MDVGDILGFGASAATGGLFGLLGFGVKALFGWLADREKTKLLKQQNEHELALLREQRETRAQELENERQISADELRKSSYDFANVTGQPVWKWVSSVVSLMRPALTLYLLFVASVIVFESISGPQPDPTTRKEAVGLVLMLTATAVTWWFGDRPPQRR